MKNNQVLEQGEDLIDLRKVVQFLQRYYRLILSVTFFVTILGGVLSFVVAPKYTATTSILIETRANNVVDVEAVLGGLGSDDKVLQSQIEIMGSNAVASRVIEKLNLADAPEFLSTTSLISGILASVLPAPDEKIDTLESDSADGLNRRVLGGLSVKLRPRTTVVDVSYEASSPHMAARVANGFADSYLVDQLETKYDATRRANDWLSTRLTELREQVRASEQAVEIYRRQNNLQVAEGNTINEGQLVSLNERLVAAKAETAAAKAKVDQIEKVRKEGGSAAAFADAAQSSVITQLRSKASDVARQEAELSTRYGGRHPQVIAVRSQLADFNRQISEELQRIVNTAENALAVAQSREQSIAADLEQLRSVTSTENQAQVYLRELMREASANRALYESFLTRFKETQAAENINGVDSRILNKAVTPASASFPNKKLFVALSLVLGVMLGTGISLLLELFDNTLKSQNDVEDRLGVPLYSMIPTIPEHANKIGSRAGFSSVFQNIKTRFGLKNKSADETKKIRSLPKGIGSYAADNPLHQYAEAIRTLRSRIRFAGVDKPVKTILVTSSIPGEGKSTVSLNLAQYAAKAGEKVLLIDADLRHPVSSDALTKGKTESIIDVISGQAKLVDVLVNEPGSNFYFLPAPQGKSMWNTAEVLSSDVMKKLIESVANSFDLVIIDSSPVLPVIDSRVLCKDVDGVVMVSAWDRTDRVVVEQAKDLIDNAGGRVMGMVLNSYDANRAKRYRYEAQYGYGYYKYEAYSA
ncbi:chain-length determining protein [Pseudovibrio japonicus]|uniref:non-specific protein-tyrosine kinase n=1 Tax=Pseudovibrio japonicus TaxID=366534 RepID=A0ABQ3EPF1_9HYPH|nr:polysaccharide biosynthesis tyrosine autokinase [Pseudovibrio japonicus]GHB49702.1 chain-length determining protein [Pseudovibrio japonicus]